MREPSAACHGSSCSSDAVSVRAASRITSRTRGVSSSATNTSQKKRLRVPESSPQPDASSSARLKRRIRPSMSTQAEVARRRLDHGLDELALALEVVEARLELVVEVLQLDLVALALGDVAHDEDDLVVADRRDARLEVAPLVERRASTRSRPPSCDCDHARDAGRDRFADVRRKDLADVVPEELVRRVREQRLVAGLDVEVVPLVIEAEHEVGQRVDESAQPRLGAGQLRQAPLALERQPGRGAHAVEEIRVVQERSRRGGAPQPGGRRARRSWRSRPVSGSSGELGTLPGEDRRRRPAPGASRRSRAKGR